MTPVEKAQKDRQEFMRNQVIESELQTRYWKSMYETKYYTLEDAKLKETYEAYYKQIQSEAIEAAEELEAIPDKNLTIETSVIKS